MLLASFIVWFLCGPTKHCSILITVSVSFQHFSNGGSTVKGALKVICVAPNGAIRTNHSSSVRCFSVSLLHARTGAVRLCARKYFSFWEFIHMAIRFDVHLL